MDTSNSDLHEYYGASFSQSFPTYIQYYNEDAA